MKWTCLPLILVAGLLRLSPTASADPSELPRDSAGQILQPNEMAVEGFLGLPWGVCHDAAKKIMAEKGFTYVGPLDLSRSKLWSNRPSEPDFS